MNTVFRLLFTAVWFGAITPAQADVQGQAEASQTAAGQIDSSTVEVGALDRQGERQPVSGAWTKLDTATEETTSMTRRIISKLIMGDLSRSVSAIRDSTQVDSGYAKAGDQDSGQGKRIAGQLIVGTFIVVIIFNMFSGLLFGVPGM